MSLPTGRRHTDDLRALRLTWIATAFIAALAISACGAASGGTRNTPDTDRRSVAKTPAVVIDLYSSLPKLGPQASEGVAIEQGIRTGLAALEQPAGHVDQYIVRYVSLNDANRNGWSAKMAAANAAEAASDPRAALYIGELNSGATEISLPILNQAGIVQVTPGSAYVGLTSSVPDSVTLATEPNRFYPNAKLRNLLRLIPDEMVQASAILDAFSKVGPCQRVSGATFGGTTEGASYLAAIQATARDYNMTFVSTKLSDTPTAAELATYVQTLRTDGVQCLVLTGRRTATATALVRLLRIDLPHEQVIGTSGYCTGALGIPGTYCVSPVLPLADYSGGVVYAQDYRKAISAKHPASPYGVYGFMAAELAVAAIDAINGTDIRTELQRSLLGGGVVTSSEIIGALEFDADGNLSDYRRVGLYQGGANGRLQLVDVISPSASKVVGPG